MSFSQQVVDVVYLTSVIGPLALTVSARRVGSLCQVDSLDQAHDELDAGGFGLLNSTIQQCETIGTTVQTWFAIVPHLIPDFTIAAPGP